MCSPIELVNDNGELTRVEYDIETAPSEVYIIGAALAAVTVASLLDITGFREDFRIVRVVNLRNDIVGWELDPCGCSSRADNECRSWNSDHDATERLVHFVTIMSS